MRYAIVDHLTHEVLNIVECAEHEIEHVLVGPHLKVPLTDDVRLGDVLHPEPTEPTEPTEPKAEGDADAH